MKTRKEVVKELCQAAFPAAIPDENGCTYMDNAELERLYEFEEAINQLVDRLVVTAD